MVGDFVVVIVDLGEVLVLVVYCDVCVGLVEYCC